VAHTKVSVDLGLINGIRPSEQRIHVVQGFLADPIIARLAIARAQRVIDLHIYIHLIVEPRTLELAALPKA
jgi:hypothetical protein